MEHSIVRGATRPKRIEFGADYDDEGATNLIPLSRVRGP